MKERPEKFELVPKELPLKGTKVKILTCGMAWLQDHSGMIGEVYQEYPATGTIQVRLSNNKFCNTREFEIVEDSV